MIAGFYIDAGGVQHSYNIAVAGRPGRLGAVNDPSAPPFSTFAASLNDPGEIVGEWQDSSGVFHGFTDQAGNFTAVSDPAGAEGTAPEGISNTGVIVGFYTDSNAVNHGFELTG